MSHFFTKHKDRFILLSLMVLALLGYYQISFFIYPLKFDMLDCYYPSRYIVGECLKNHVLPFWNPYLFLGYPIHADPQSGAWYPFAWIIGYLWGYDVCSLSFEFIIHLFLAGTGMYLLGRTLNMSRRISYIMAVSFMFCGFFVGNAQHLTWIISGTWTPYILSSYIKLIRNGSWLESLKTGFFMYMHIAGGYPAATIILTYMIAILFLLNIFYILKKKTYDKIKTFIFCNLTFGITTILFSSFILVSIYYLIPNLTRAQAITLEKALFSPFSPQSMISFLLPYTSVKELTYFNTDLSMSNGYIGLICLIFYLYSLFIKKTPMMWFFLIFGLFALMSSMGEYLPVRTFLFDHIPLMNMFRFPSIFRLYFIISAILLSGYSLQYFKLKTRSTIPVFIGIGLTFVVILLLCFFKAFKSIGGLVDFIHTDIFIDSVHSTLLQHLLFQGLIQLVLLGLLIFCMLFISNNRKQLNCFILIVSIEMILSFQLNAPYTALSKEYKSKDIMQFSRSFPSGFPMPSNKVSMNSDTCGFAHVPLWKNLSGFHKRISYDGFSSFQLSNYEMLSDHFTPLFLATINNHLIYLSDKVNIDSAISKQSNYSSKDLFLNNHDYQWIKQLPLNSDLKDTVYITAFSPLKISAIADVKHMQIITLLQNCYPGWHIYINGKEERIIRSNLCFISSVLPAGKSKIDYVFNLPILRISFYITFFSLLFFGLFLLIYSRRKK